MYALKLHRPATDSDTVLGLSRGHLRLREGEWAHSFVHAA